MTTMTEDQQALEMVRICKFTRGDIVKHTMLSATTRKKFVVKNSILMDVYKKANMFTPAGIVVCVQVFEKGVETNEIYLPQSHLKRK